MKVVVLAGGISTERDVSLISGKMIYQAMKRLGHQAVLLDVFLGMERDDIDHIFESDEDFSAGIEGIHEINPDISAVKALRKDGGKCYFGPNVIKICQMADVVFLGLHGADGEGGKVQAAFDLLGIRYTGTDFVSGALAMDKCLAKELFLQNGIPTPAGFRLKKGQEPEEGRQPKFPCVVKVSSGGSSIGVSIVQKEEDYQAALDDAFLYGDEVVVEEYIKGRELTCCVLDGKALPIVEIAPKKGFMSYASAGYFLEPDTSDTVALFKDWPEKKRLYCPVVDGEQIRGEKDFDTTKYNFGIEISGCKKYKELEGLGKSAYAGITNSSKKQEEAAAFLKFLTDDTLKDGDVNPDFAVQSK